MSKEYVKSLSKGLQIAVTRLIYSAEMESHRDIITNCSIHYTVTNLVVHVCPEELDSQTKK